MHFVLMKYYICEMSVLNLNSDNQFNVDCLEQFRFNFFQQVADFSKKKHHHSVDSAIVASLILTR